MAEAFAYAAKNNRVSCVSSGNDNSSSTSIYPANYGSQIIDVGATDQQDNRPSFSNYGVNLDVVAPGLNIESINYAQFGSLLTLDGTSLSSPIVAGIASLLKGYDNDLYNDDIEQLIKISADDILPPGRDDYTGYGRVNAANALNYLKPPSKLQHFTAAGGSAYISSNMYLIILGGRKILDNSYHVLRTEVRKTINLPNTYCSITGVWGTGLKTTGWHDNQGFCYGDGFCEVVPGSLTSTQVTLRTYVYQVYNAMGVLGNYYPIAPQNVTFAYSVLGIPGPTTINGDNSFCNTSNNYTIPNLPSGATVQWQATPSSIVTLNSPNATQTTLTKTGNGVIALTATIANSCGATTLNKTISVGVPPVTIAGPSSICACQCCNYYTATNIPGATYTWSIFPAAGNSVAGDMGNQAEVIITSPCYLTVQATTPCGTSSTTFHIFMKAAGQCNGGCSAPSFVIAPNPAQNNITISLANTQNNKTSETQTGYQVSGIKSVQVYDISGHLIKQRQTSGSKTQQMKMDVSSLANGTYSIVIFDGEIIETHEIIIQR